MPSPGAAFLSERETDKKAIVELARELHEKGFNLVATGGTAKVIRAGGIACQHVNKVKEGRPHIVDMIMNDEIVLIVNTSSGSAHAFGMLYHHHVRGQSYQHGDGTPRNKRSILLTIFTLGVYQ